MSSQADQREPRPGEELFAGLLFLLGAVALAQSVLLWLRMSPPRAASAAALPLAVSLVWTVSALLVLAETHKKNARSAVKQPLAARWQQAWRYALPRRVLVMLLFIIAYGAALLAGISFYLLTPLFLWGSMSYLTGKGYLKNLLWTGLYMAFILLVFKALFGVVLP